MVPLIRRPQVREASAFNTRISHILLVASLPFYKANGGTYTHRVRSGEVHLWDGKPTHTTFLLWCGMSGSSGNGALIAETEPGAVVCSTCEGRATGAGQLDSHTINGRFVRFSPRIAAWPPTKP
mgnify:CR=1 FL=1